MAVVTMGVATEAVDWAAAWVAGGMAVAMVAVVMVVATAREAARARVALVEGQAEALASAMVVERGAAPVASGARVL